MTVLDFLPSDHFLRTLQVPKNSDLSVESELLERNPNAIIFGCDEAGRGPLAGAVTAAAVHIPAAVDISGYNDSKKMNEAARQQVAKHIIENCICSITSINHQKIDEMNIRAASLHAMSLAIHHHQVKAHAVLIDGNAVPPKLPCPGFALIKGDARSASIAAASILAKTLRDAQMREAHKRWPQYGFDQHKGYPTKAHIAALERFGPCPIHRRSFAPVTKLLDSP